MATIDATMNVTLEVDDDTWYETLDAFDGNEEEALYEIVSGLESEVRRRLGAARTALGGRSDL